MQALILTADEREKLTSVLGYLVSHFPARTAGCQIDIIECIRILTSPRTEALGLSKEEWLHWSSYLKNEFAHEEHEAAVAMEAIASSLSDKGEA